MADKEITLGMIMSHIQHMETRILNKMSYMQTSIDSMDKRIDRNHRNLTFQIDAIDKRLDDIEIEQLPKRVSAIEHHLGLAV
jgi:hypothetical protein